MVELAYDPRGKSAMFSGLPIRVHSWGGFGSQLNALALAIEIRVSNPRRMIELVFHTGGVTKRELEISSLVPADFKISINDDYRVIVDNARRKLGLKSLITILFESLSLVVKPNDNNSLRRIKPWTVSVRGHYSYIKHSRTVIAKLLEQIDISPETTLRDGSVTHYRLGDLLSLEKGFVHPESVLRIMRSISPQDWVILTDSPKEAREFIHERDPYLQLKSIEKVDAIEVIRRGTVASTFVGTSSKLSIWIALFRCNLRQSGTYLPENLRETIQSITRAECLNLIHFYN